MFGNDGVFKGCKCGSDIVSERNDGRRGTGVIGVSVVRSVAVGVGQSPTETHGQTAIRLSYPCLGDDPSFRSRSCQGFIV